MDCSQIKEGWKSKNRKGNGGRVGEQHEVGQTEIIKKMIESIQTEPLDEGETED